MNSLKTELESEGETNHSDNEDLISQPRHSERINKGVHLDRSAYSAKDHSGTEMLERNREDE